MSGRSDGDARAAGRASRALATALSRARELERRRIAGGLHDHVGQILAVARLKLIAAQQDPGIDRTSVLAELRGHLEEAIRSVRTMAFELDGAMPSPQDLEGALRRLGEKILKPSGVRFEFRGDGGSRLLRKERAALVCLVLRELLFNVVKHARARRAVLRASVSDRELVFTLEDDGVGFDTRGRLSKISVSNGFGLYSARRRIREAGGHLDIASVPGEGTRIALSLPLQTPDAPPEGAEGRWQA